MTLFESAPYNPATIHSPHPARGTTPIGSRRIAPIPRAFHAAFAFVAALPLSLAPVVSAWAADSSVRTRTASPQLVRTLAQDLHGATFEYVPGEVRFDTLSVNGVSYSRVTVAGAIIGEAPGNPALPTATLYAGVPDGMSPRLTIVGEEWNERAGPPPPIPVPRQRYVSDDPAQGPVLESRVEPNPEVYGRGAIFPSRSAYLTRGGAVGELWVVPIQVRPVRWDPRGRAFRLLRRMSLRVDFVPATAAERAQRPAFRPGGDSGFWGRVQKGMVRNYESARSFPIRPAAAPRPAAKARSAVNPEFKLLPVQSGWTSVSYATLSAAGFPPGIPIATIGVSQRGYDDVADGPTDTPIAVVARDPNGNGTFDGGDAIAFYAQTLSDRLGAASIENRYTSDNVYWLTWSAGAAASADSVSGAIAGSPTTSSSFHDTIHLEQNRYLLAAPSPGATSPPEAVPYIFWTRGDDLDNNDVFETTIPFVDPDPTQPFRIRSYYQGQNNFQHHLDLFYQSSSGVTDTLGLNRTFFHQDVFVLDTGFTVPGSHIGANTGPGNRYRHIGTREPPDGGNIVAGSRSWLDWVEVTYPRLYRAVGNSLTFGSGTALGLVEMTVTGFTAPGIEVYDVTDPHAPSRVTGTTVGGSNPYDVTFRTDASAGERRFVAVVPGSEVALGTGRVVMDSPSHLTVPDPFTPSSLARTVIIAPESFVAAASAPVTRLADYRRGQGYVVQVAGIQDVYDEFNGGLKSPLAIRRYLRHAYLTWTPRLLNALLIGDASIDYRHQLPTSSADLVPTYFKFESVQGPLGVELVANESWYARELNLAVPVDGEDLPSIVLSRIPAGTPEDLDAFVTKVIAYENFQPTDAWRGRSLLVSDDAFSTGIFANTSYCYNSFEEDFRGTNQTFDLIEGGSTGGQDMTSDFYDLRTYTDAVPATPDPFGCRSLTSVVNTLGHTGGGYSAMASKLTQGGLILNVVSHANRYLLAHEVIYCTGSPRGGCPTGSPGPGDFNNVGRPFFGMVWGCHTNEFADGPVLAEGTVDSSDAIGEQWLLLNNRGTIGSVGSSAFEVLPQISNFSNAVADAFFTTPPADDSTSPRQVRWILGEVFASAQVTNGLSFDPSQSAMNHTVNLLADPMLRMDALPPRVFEVELDGAAIQDGGLLVSNSATDSAQVVAKLRDEVAIRSVQLTEQDLVGGPAVPIDSTGYAVAYVDSSRQATLTARIRPRVGNYDVQIRATDLNGRAQLFTLQVRTPVRYFANGIEIVNGVFVGSGARVRADITTPIPVTADSLELFVDGVSTASSKSGAGRQWSLDALPGFAPGTHTLQIAVGGRTAGFQLVTFQVSAEFTMRGVAVVSPKVQGAGCGGSIFQYELSSSADKVELLLMTVAGRRVSSIRIPGNAGFNVYCWDGRDSEGHDTAIGVYLFRIRATDATGRTVTQNGRMIRTS